MQGFIHPVGVSGILDQVKITFIVRSFSTQGLIDLENELKI